MKYYLVDKEFTIIDGIECYISMIWNNKYYETGDFELYLPATPKSAEMWTEAAKNGYYIIRADEYNDRHNKNMHGMIVQKVQTDYAVKDQDNLIITGPCLKGLLNQRIVYGKYDCTGKAEEELRKLVDMCAINPSDPDRRIPFLELGEVNGIADMINTRLQGTYLNEACTTLCKTVKIGWDIVLDWSEKKFKFIVYKGVDRSYGQTGELSTINPYVVFSDDFNNLMKTTYKVDMSKFRNVAFVDAEYTKVDEQAKTSEVLQDPQVAKSPKGDKRASGFDRYETYVDGSQILSTSTQNAYKNIGYYESLLYYKGKKALEDTEIVTDMTGEVENNDTFVLDRDYRLGDLVSIINSYDQKLVCRVTSTIESLSRSKHSYIPTFTVETFTDKKEEEDKTIKDEEVRAVDGYDGEYRVSETGEIRRVELGYEYCERAIEDNGYEYLADRGRCDTSGNILYTTKDPVYNKHEQGKLWKEIT